MRHLVKIAMYMALILTSPQLLWAGSTNNAAAPAEPDPYIRHKLKVPFPVNGKLFVAIPWAYSGMLPEIDFLYLNQGKSYKRLQTLNDLKDQVTIRNVNDALAYVHLQTSPDTERMLTSWSHNQRCEDIIFSKMRTGSLYAKLPGSSVSVHGKVFIIKRPVIVGEDTSPSTSVYYITEEISRSGAYRRLETKYLGVSTSFGISQGFIGYL